MVKNKDMKISANIYTVSYVAFIRDNKKKFRMSENDQFDLLWRSLLILAGQLFFTYCVLT